MGNSSAKQHFETAQKTGVLKISLMRLQDFPTPLKDFPNVLKTLDLSENRFVTLPEELGRFTILKHLKVNGNRLASLPEALSALVKLETLNAANNMIVRIPAGLSNMKNLKQVLLSNNHIAEFPAMLCDLKHLDILDLSRNRITVIPAGVGNLFVTELNLNQNQVAALPEELADCPQLKTLRVEENCLAIGGMHPRILKDSKISNLAVDGNLFSSKQFTDLEGYDCYMERYTAVKKKMY